MDNSKWVRTSAPRDCFQLVVPAWIGIGAFPFGACEYFVDYFLG
jgi:hypothetical protein